MSWLPAKTSQYSEVKTCLPQVSEFKVEYREAGEGATWEDVTAKVERVGAESFAGAVLLEGLKEKQVLYNANLISLL